MAINHRLKIRKWKRRSVTGSWLPLWLSARFSFVLTMSFLLHYLLIEVNLGFIINWLRGLMSLIALWSVGTFLCTRLSQSGRMGNWVASVVENCLLGPLALSLTQVIDHVLKGCHMISERRVMKTLIATASRDDCDTLNPQYHDKSGKCSVVSIVTKECLLLRWSGCESWHK